MRYAPKFQFVLADKATGQFPKNASTLFANPKLLTTSLEDTPVFDDRDDPHLKCKYYNALYRGVAEFQPFTF